MYISEETRSTAFTACWNQRAKISKRRYKHTIGDLDYEIETDQILRLDNAISELRS